MLQTSKNITITYIQMLLKQLNRIVDHLFQIEIQTPEGQSYLF